MVAQRLRHRAGEVSPRREAASRRRCKTVSRLVPGRAVLLRADSAFYGSDTSTTAVGPGAQVSVTVRQDRRVKATIGEIADDAWTPIAYREAVFDQTSRPVGVAGGGRRDPVHCVRVPTGGPASAGPAGGAADPRAQPVRARRAVRRVAVPRLLHHQRPPLDTVTADQIHRGHAVIEQVHADLKDSALAHLPTGKFAANAAWLVLAVIAFNLTRAAATPHRARTGHRDHRHAAPHPDRGARPDRHLRPPAGAAPPAGLALAGSLERAVPPGMRPARPLLA